MSIVKSVSMACNISSLLETRAIAKFLAEKCRPGDCIMLSGKIGTGKTQFARSFIQSYTSISELEVPSPTFVFDMQYTFGGNTIHHMDLYRLASRDSIGFLDLERSFRTGICLVEWPERLGDNKPAHRLDINISDSFETKNAEVRFLQLQGFGERWSEVLHEMSDRYRIPLANTSED
uniref:tRNA threonylcarbamoyladenosine biosynthesis protein TsaE n=1 Tax=Spongospora subterranea TaxID=70186 RepID=A0A0H5RBB8_9EUKA|eukprot:CRZ11505.1 hypothetical protein [Spongospora subterranea]